MKDANKYETVIGLEVHLQLSTKSKIFCGCSTRFGLSPNTQVCPVCLGFPGVLPVLNREALRYAIKAALALNCNIVDAMKFDRKNYYYPDLPKNFQISQYELPLAKDGKVEFLTNEEKMKIVRIRRVHLEEDAGKLIHVEDEAASLVDYNRSGMPLLEIVSEPDLSSPEEAYSYLSELKSILRYLGVSDCNMEEGSLRCDANISLRPAGEKGLGVKAEVKNMNTFKGVRSALQYEEVRQAEALERGDKVIQETRLWSEADGKTRPMRTKEEAFDYRYFPEPDLVPFRLDREIVESIRKSLPELPAERLGRFLKDYGLTHACAHIIVNEKEIADYFEECAKFYKDGRVITNWLTGDVQSELNRRNVTINELGLNPADLAEMLSLIDEGVISGKIAKSLLQDMIDTKKSPRELVKAKNLVQIKDRGELESVLQGIIAANPKVVEDYKKGRSPVIAFLVGEAMKATKGKANPKLVNEMLKEMMERI